VGAIAGIKWVLMQRYQPRMAPAWSFFVWRNELLTGLYDAVVIPLLEKLLGTPFINMYLRGLGVKIGKQVYIESPNFTEFDLITIGNQAALNRECIIQTHLFEDRIQKMSTIKIGDDCSIGKMSVVLYDTQMQAGSTLGNLSLLMKGEILPAHSHWQGIPAQPTQNNK
jgi:non-ribosomal peptide synthetase-like protein